MFLSFLYCVIFPLCVWLVIWYCIYKFLDKKFPDTRIVFVNIPKGQDSILIKVNR